MDAPYPHRSALALITFSSLAHPLLDPARLWRELEAQSVAASIAFTVVAANDLPSLPNGDTSDDELVAEHGALALTWILPTFNIPPERYASPSLLADWLGRAFCELGACEGLHWERIALMHTSDVSALREWAPRLGSTIEVVAGLDAQDEAEFVRALVAAALGVRSDLATAETNA